MRKVPDSGSWFATHSLKDHLDTGQQGEEKIWKASGEPGAMFLATTFGNPMWEYFSERSYHGYT